MSVLVYLDSSDFSDLSKGAEQLNDSDLHLLNFLRTCASTRAVRFAVSAIHISEAVHAAEKFKPEAVLRAALIRELCGDNLLRFPSDIFRLELDKAIGGAGPGRIADEALFSMSDEWFGFRPELASRAEKRTMANQFLREGIAHLPRRERRKLEAELDFRKRSSAAKWRELLQASPTPNVEFPLSILSRENIFSWLLEESDDNAIYSILLPILRDPYLLFEHLLSRPEDRTAFYNMAREERGWLDSIDGLIDRLFPHLLNAHQFNFSVSFRKMMIESWRNSGINQKAIKAYSGILVANTDEAKALVRKCPALSTFIETLKFYFLDMIDANLSRIRDGGRSAIFTRPSDYGDFLHATYVPYMGIFRCDNRFGAVLKRHPALRSRIADRRSALATILEASREPRQAAY